MSNQLINNTDCLNKLSSYLTLNDKFQLYFINKSFNNLAKELFNKYEISLIFYNKFFNYNYISIQHIFNNNMLLYKPPILRRSARVFGYGINGRYITYN